jgi:hypothetical protein
LKVCYLNIYNSLYIEFKEDKTDEFEGEEWALVNDSEDLNSSNSGSEKEKSM